MEENKKSGWLMGGNVMIEKAKKNKNAQRILISISFLIVSCEARGWSGKRDGDDEMIDFDSNINVI